MTTPYAIKMRSDQLYDASSMERMYEWFKKYRKERKIFVAGTYPKLLFHPRDHIFWGATSDLINLFSCPLEQNGLVGRIRVKKEDLFDYIEEFTRSETYLGAHYIAQFHPEVNRFLLHPEKYLYDGAPERKVAHRVSLKLTDEYFAPFPSPTRCAFGENCTERPPWRSHPAPTQAFSL